MFTNVSMTGTGLLITLVEALFAVFGVHTPDGSIAEGINGLVTFIGLILVVWGQLRRSDLIAGIVRRASL